MSNFLLVPLILMMTCQVIEASANHRWSFFSLTKTCFHNYGHSLALYENTRSIFRCCERCMEEPLCAAILFDATTKRCQTNMSPADLGSLPVDCGSIYAEISKHSESVHTLGGWNSTCTTTADCGLPNSTCGAQGRCICSPGYSYNFTVQRCVVNCTVYGTTFQVDPEMTLMGYNDDYLSSKTAEQCRAACVAATSFTCRTFEHSGSGSCRLSTKTMLDVPQVYVTEQNTNLYQRNCA